jgi:hypothetical protein
VHMIYLTTSTDRLLFAASAKTPSAARAIFDREVAALPHAMRNTFLAPTTVTYTWANDEDGRIIIRNLRDMLEKHRMIATLPIAYGVDHFMSWLQMQVSLPVDKSLRAWTYMAASSLPHAPRTEKIAR